MYTKLSLESYELKASYLTLVPNFDIILSLAYLL